MMKKITVILLVIILVVTCIIASSCNKQLFDTTYNFKYAYVMWPDGKTEKLKITSWNDYDGEQLQIKTEKGTFVFHSSNCVLGTE